MGIGKWLLGGLAAAGAVIAAPVVLPLAAGAVATAGTAVAGVAAAAGTAVASTSVGAAAVGAMATVGTAVGTAAGAVGLGSVATVAGTSAGAAALGTIATSAAVGAGTAISGGVKMLEASEIKEEAIKKYNQERDNFDVVEKQAKGEFEKLGKEKVLLWGSFGRFIEAYQKINNKGCLTGNVEKDEMDALEIVELQEAKVLAISAQDFVKGGVVTATSAQLIGMASSAGFTSLATASTGAAIGGLHGAAASNAALAALGGGAKAAGGLGMAGGAVVSQALMFAPAVAIGGVMLNSKGKKALKNAESIREESEEVMSKLQEATRELKKVKSLVASMRKSLKRARENFDGEVKWLEEFVANKDDAATYTDFERKRVTSIAYQLKILKRYTMIKIIEDDKYRLEQSSKEKEELESQMNI